MCLSREPPPPPGLLSAKVCRVRLTAERFSVGVFFSYFLGRGCGNDVVYSALCGLPGLQGLQGDAGVKWGIREEGGGQTTVSFLALGVSVVYLDHVCGNRQ